MKSFLRLNAAVAAAFFLFAIPLSAESCVVSDRHQLTCALQGVPDEAAIKELLPFLEEGQNYSTRQQAAQILINLLNERGLVADQPNAAFAALVSLGNSVRDDTYWDQALDLVLGNGVAAPAKSRDFVEFVERRAHQLRIAGDFDAALDIVVATFGDDPVPNGGRNLNIFGTVQAMHAAGHLPSTQLLDKWSGASPLQSELLIVQALDGDPEAQFLIGQALVEGGGRAALNLRRVTTRTGHLEGGPYDAAKGAEFLEAALAGGIAEAGPVLQKYREQQRLLEEEKERVRIAEAEAEAERKRLAEKARAERIAEAAKNAQANANRESAIDVYLREQNTHVNRVGIYWNSCVAEAQSPEWGARYCDCVVVRSVELLGQERANIALAVGAGINDQFLRQVVSFCVGLTRR